MATRPRAEYLATWIEYSELVAPGPGSNNRSERISQYVRIDALAYRGHEDHEESSRVTVVRIARQLTGVVGHAGVVHGRWGCEAGSVAQGFDVFEQDRTQLGTGDLFPRSLEMEQVAFDGSSDFSGVDAGK